MVKVELPAASYMWISAAAVIPCGQWVQVGFVSRITGNLGLPGVTFSFPF